MGIIGEERGAGRHNHHGYYRGREGSREA